jgi:hypothetical protein
MKRRFALPLLVVVTAGCYHATIETGLTPAPGAHVIDMPWAMGFVYGLVPPATVNASQKGCPGGVARVETEHSFLNSLVGGFTFGIVTPMHIRITCAGARAELPAGTPEIAVRADAAPGVVQSVFATAADLAVETGKPVAVKFISRN